MDIYTLNRLLSFVNDIRAIVRFHKPIQTLGLLHTFSNYKMNKSMFYKVMIDNLTTQQIVHPSHRGVVSIIKSK